MIKQRCYDMLREALDQVQARLPANKNVFLYLNSFSKDKVLSYVSRFPFAELPLSHLLGDNADMVENQYHNINFTLGRKKKLFQGDIPKDTVGFWLCIRKYNNSTGS